MVTAAASVLIHQLKSLEFEGELLTILCHKQKGFSGNKKLKNTIKTMLFEHLKDREF